MSMAEIEELMTRVINLFSDWFPTHAILKGGMELRLADCPRFTNDLDYVFIPFKSKTEIKDKVLEALCSLRDTSVTLSVHSKCLRYVIYQNENRIQIEINTAENCSSEPMSTASLVEKTGLPVKIIRVMSWDVALAHKLTAWNERNLIRDLYDASFMYSVLNVRPDLLTLKDRLSKVSYRIKKVGTVKSMTIEQFIEKLRSSVVGITQSDVEGELRDFFPPDQLPGLQKRISVGINSIVNWIENCDH